jgi:nucleotide-binding universal stress UspA family protein
MLGIHRILVPVDLTAASADTLRYAIAWAELFGSEVYVLHVVPDVLPYTVGVDVVGLAVPTVRDEWLDDARTALAELVASVPIAPEQVRTVVCAGQAAAVIERYAAEHYMDLIVMASHRHSAMARVALGSVAEQVVRKAPCPVVTVPPESKVPRWLGGVRTMLMPTDLGETSRATFEYGRELAVCLGSDLRVLHVVVPPWERQLTYLPPAGVISKLEQLTGARPDSTCFECEVDRICDVQSAIRVGDPVGKIMDYADNTHADLIVMATHGRNAFARMVLGSITSKVLRKAHCPVLTLSASACERVYEAVPVMGEGLLMPA